MTTTMGIGGCSADCEAQYGDGAAALAALEACIYCEACFDLCEPQGYCPNGGIEGGCSAMFQECGACAYSACSWTFDGSSFSGVCAAPYQACDTHPNCNNLWSCRNGC
jgi:hypothetical protein